MTKLCLGTVQFGMNYGIQGNGQPSSTEAINILNKAYNAGIKAYDTAAAYGTAESVLKAFLSQPHINRNTVKIISKTKSHDTGMIDDAKCSLENLGADFLDGCLLHDAKYVFDSAAVQNLMSLKETGLSKEIGVSVYTPDEALKCLEYDFLDIIQAPYNVLDRRLDKCGFFEKAKEQGICVCVRSVLLQGLLMMNPSALPQHMGFAASVLSEFQEICRTHNLRYFEGAVGYVLQHPDIDYLVFGVDNISQLDEYISLASQNVRDDIADIFMSKFNDVDEKILMPNLWQS